MRIHFYPLRCAMHGAAHISTKRWGYICFKPPTYVYGRWWPAYLYLSPNATPWGATLIWGKGYTRAEKMMASLRRVLWGHGYSTDKHDPQLAMAYIRSFEGELPSSMTIGWVHDLFCKLNRLRNSEGASVTIFCDNPDADNSQEQAAIEVTDDWTNWEAKRYTGRDWAEAVAFAHADMQAALTPAAKGGAE